MDPIDGKQDAIAQVEGGAFPIWLGQGRPQAAIIEEDGRFRIRAVVVDPQAVAAASTPRTRTPSWMPVHQVARGWPGGWPRPRTPESPEWWPTLSLMCLNRSKSIIRAAN